MPIPNERVGEILIPLHQTQEQEDRTVTFTLKELMDLNPMLSMHPLGPHWLRSLIETHKELAKRREGRVTKAADKLLYPRTVAAMLNVSMRTVYRMVKDGRLSAIRIGRLIRIPYKEVKRFAARNQIKIRKNVLK